MAAGLGDEAIGAAAGIKVDAERKAGGILGEMRESGERADQGRPGKTYQSVTLFDLGITGKQSSRWQRLARLPDADLRRRDCRAGQLADGRA